MTKTLYILGSPIWDVRQAIRLKGFHGFADGLNILDGNDSTPPTLPVALHGEVRWCAWGSVYVNSLDHLTDGLGERMTFDDALEWFGVRL